jgi:chemotaxis methyl-accepting protein methylase
MLGGEAKLTSTWSIELVRECNETKPNRWGGLDMDVKQMIASETQMEEINPPIDFFASLDLGANEADYVQQAYESTHPKMSDHEYRVWRELIQQRCGLHIAESRMHFMSRRLWERMRLNGIRSYSEYYNHVVFNSNGENEWKELLELLLNLETGFFRHAPSFKAFSDHILPTLMREKHKHDVNTISIWSAGCSTGAEPYSLAMTLLETIDSTSPFDGGEVAALMQEEWQLKISATDISNRSLDKARRGRYKPHELRYISDPYRDKYLMKIEESKGVTYQVVDRVRELVQFGYLNLNDLDSYWITAQDVIFCQNVLIYFQSERRVPIIEQLCRRLNPGGYLILAPAEVVGLKLSIVQQVRQADSLIYQRIK